MDKMKKLVFKASYVQPMIARRALKLNKIEVVLWNEERNHPRYEGLVRGSGLKPVMHTVEICMNHSFGFCSCQDFQRRAEKHRCVYPCKHIIKLAQAADGGPVIDCSEP